MSMTPYELVSVGRRAIEQQHMLIGLLTYPFAMRNVD